MAKVSAAQAAKIAAAFPQFAAVAALADVGDLKVETVMVKTLVATARRHLKVKLPSGQIVAIED